MDVAGTEHRLWSWSGSIILCTTQDPAAAFQRESGAERVTPGRFQQSRSNLRVASLRKNFPAQWLVRLTVGPPNLDFRDRIADTTFCLTVSFGRRSEGLDTQTVEGDTDSCR